MRGACDPGRVAWMQPLGVAVGRALGAALDHLMPGAEVVAELPSSLWSGSSLGLLGFAAANHLPLELMVAASPSAAGWVSEVARTVGCRTERGTTEEGRSGPVVYEISDSGFAGPPTSGTESPVETNWPGVSSIAEALTHDDRVVVVGTGREVSELARTFGAHRAIEIAIDLDARVAVGVGLAQRGWKPIIVATIAPSALDRGVWPSPTSREIEVHCGALFEPGTAPIVVLLAPYGEVEPPPWNVTIATAGPPQERDCSKANGAVVRLTRIRPLALAELAAAVRVTGRLVVALGEPYASEIVAAAARACFYDLDAPVAMMAGRGAPGLDAGGLDAGGLRAIIDRLAQV